MMIRMAAEFGLVAFFCQRQLSSTILLPAPAIDPCLSRPAHPSTRNFRIPVAMGPAPGLAKLPIADFGSFDTL